MHAGWIFTDFFMILVIFIFIYPPTLTTPKFLFIIMYFFLIDNVFGCHLATLCAQEKTTVPRFVEKCIKAVEKRGTLCLTHE